MRTVCRRHVLGLGEEAFLTVPAGVAGHAPTMVEDLDHA
jgi:hypothetical protein